MLKFKNKNLLMLLALILISTVAFTACKTDEDPNKTPQVQDEGHGVHEDGETGNRTQETSWAIVVETLDGRSVDIAGSDFEDIGLTTMKATALRKDGTEEENEWTGIKIKDALEFAEIDEYDSVEIESGDGFSEIYSKEIVKNDGAILAIKKDGQDLDEGSWPVRVIVEGERTNLWLKNVAKIRVKN